MAMNKVAKGCLIATAVVAVLSIIVVVAIILCGLISAIAIPTVVNEADKAKKEIVEKNAHEGTSGLSEMIESGKTPPEVIELTIIMMNQNATPDDPSDDIYSPYDPTLKGYAETPGPGVVTFEYNPDDKTYTIKGHDKNGNECIEMKAQGY